MFDREELKKTINKTEEERCTIINKEQSAMNFRGEESRSKSNSESPSHLQYRSRSTSSASKSRNLDEKLEESTSETLPLFRCPQNVQINPSELHRIRVNIHRNIPANKLITELQRDILNPEDVIVKRRKGEGCKPIFDREELNKTNEVKERRTIVAINKEQSASTIKSRPLRKRSLSPIRNKVYSRYTSYQSRRDLKECREYKEKYTERDANKHDKTRSRSKESRNSHSRSFIEEKSYRDRYRERSNERSPERRDRDRNRNRDRDRDKDKDKDKDEDEDEDKDKDAERDRDRERDRNRDRTKDTDRSRERRDIIPHYIESPIPVPIYYSSFPPRPIVVSPMVPLRGQIFPMGRGYPALMAPVRPFPRFPPYMYRGHPPSNPRYGPF